MAGRTSVGIGWGVAFSIISVIALGLFVTTVVFYAQKQAATKKFNELQTGVNEFVKEGERERDDIKQLRNAATKKNQSLVAFLTGKLGTSRIERSEKLEGSLRELLYLVLSTPEYQVG